MADPLITRKQLENRLGAVTVERLSDDNGDGSADPNVVDQILAEASDFVRGGMPQHNPDDLTPANAIVTGELRRLALDYAEMLAAKRRPTIYKRDWIELKKSVLEDLNLLLKGQRSLGSNDKPKPADNSVSVVSGDPGQGQYWP